MGTKLATIVLGAGTAFLAGGPASASSCAFTTLDVPGANATAAYGSNDAGQVVGYYDGANAR